MRRSRGIVASFWREHKPLVIVHFVVAGLFLVMGFVFLFAVDNPTTEIDTFVIFELGAVSAIWYDRSYLKMRDVKDWTTVYIDDDKIVSYSSSFFKEIMEEICVVNLHEPVYCEIVIITGATLIDYFNVYVVSNEPIAIPQNPDKKYRFRNDYDKSKQILINSTDYTDANYPLPTWKCYSQTKVFL